MLGGRDVALVDGPVFLVGLFLALSPWMLHFTTSQAPLVVHNVIIGAALAALAIGFAVTPARMYGLSWAMVIIGAWLIASPWVVGSSPDRGVIITQCIAGGLTALLGLICTGAALRASRMRART